jgi:hypothetical protein
MNYDGIILFCNKLIDKVRGMSFKIELTNIIVSAIVSISIAYSTYMYSSEQSKNTLNLKYIELAINILKMPSSSENNGLKEYATKILKKYSEVPFTEEVEKEFNQINFFLSGYELDIQEKKGDEWINIGGVSTSDLSKIAPIPSSTIRWHILKPFNTFVGENEYKSFTHQNADKIIKEFVDNAKKEHAEKYNIVK